MPNTVNLNVVQAQANALGISYHHRAGAEKISGLVVAHLAANPQDAVKLVPDPAVEEKPLSDGAFVKSIDVPVDQPLKSKGDPCPVTPLTSKEYHKHEEKGRVKKIGALKRVIIQCLNPAKREQPGEIISVGSARHGTYKKFIPFNNEPYHIPQIIYDELKERKCTLYRTEKMEDGRGGSRRVGYLTDEFSIVDLPPLTEEEIEKLREKQQLAKAGL